MASFYKNTVSFIRNHHLSTSIVYLAKTTPIIVATIYIITLTYLAFTLDKRLLITIIKPLSAFTLVTIMRKVIDRNRPFIKYNFEPLYSKKTNESFPSRHTVSAMSIALLLFNIDLLLGSVALIFASIVAICRILCGVHFISDVLVAIIISILIFIV